MSAAFEYATIPQVNAVRVTAADYNPRSAKPFDGSPFSDHPEWLLDALNAGKVRPVTPGHTDYAEWEVDGAGVLAGPGDFIERSAEGVLSVRKI